MGINKIAWSDYFYFFSNISIILSNLFCIIFIFLYGTK